MNWVFKDNNKNLLLYTLKWMMSDIETIKDNKWVFNGVILFNNSHYEPLFILNHSVGIYKSTPENPGTIWIWSARFLQLTAL